MRDTAQNTIYVLKVVDVRQSDSAPEAGSGTLPTAQRHFDGDLWRSAQCCLSVPPFMTVRDGQLRPSFQGCLRSFPRGIECHGSSEKCY